MSTPRRFSISRLWAIVVKEFIQMRRDRVTFGMMIGIPLIQLVLFGYAINSDPKHLPTAVLLADYGPQGRTLLHAIRNSDVLRIRAQSCKPRPKARDVLARGRSAVRGEHSRRISRAICFAANGRRCSSRPTRPTPRPPATPSALCACWSTWPRANDLKGPARASSPASDEPSICAFTRTTTPKRSRNTTSCPA